MKELMQYSFQKQTNKNPDKQNQENPKKADLSYQVLEVSSHKLHNAYKKTVFNLLIVFSRTNEKALGKNKYSEWKQVACYLQVLPFVPAIFSLPLLLLLMLLKILD